MVKLRPTARVACQKCGGVASDALQRRSRSRGDATIFAGWWDLDCLSVLALGREQNRNRDRTGEGLVNLGLACT